MEAGMFRLIVALLLVFTSVPIAWSQEVEIPNVVFFYPLSTRRPVIERELEFRVNYEKGSADRLTEVRGAVEFPVLPRWQIELEIPVVFRSPHDAPWTGGVGDLTVENKFLLYRSLDYPAQVAAGFEARLPSGSERRGLGGEAALEPFLTAGIAVGDFDLLAEIAYEFNINAHVPGPQEQQLTAGTAVGYRMSRWFTPLLELTTRTLTRGDERSTWLHRTEVSLTPGLNLRPLPATTFALGIELPVTHAREFDYALRARLIREF
jgi:hypothetical protein